MLSGRVYSARRCVWYVIIIIGRGRQPYDGLNANAAQAVSVWPRLMSTSMVVGERARWTLSTAHWKCDADATLFIFAQQMQPTMRTNSCQLHRRAQSMRARSRATANHLWLMRSPHTHTHIHHQIIILCASFARFYWRTKKKNSEREKNTQ